jgi:hypothetical protein
VSGETRIDSLVSTKDPRLVQIEHTLGESGRRLVERMYPLVAEVISNGLLIPSRASTLCGYCPYARMRGGIGRRYRLRSKPAARRVGRTQIMRSTLTFRDGCPSADAMRMQDALELLGEFDDSDV